MTDPSAEAQNLAEQPTQTMPQPQEAAAQPAGQSAFFLNRQSNRSFVPGALKTFPHQGQQNGDMQFGGNRPTNGMAAFSAIGKQSTGQQMPFSQQNGQQRPFGAPAGPSGFRLGARPPVVNNQLFATQTQQHNQMNMQNQMESQGMGAGGHPLKPQSQQPQFAEQAQRELHGGYSFSKVGSPALPTTQEQQRDVQSGTQLPPQPISSIPIDNEASATKQTMAPPRAVQPSAPQPMSQAAPASNMAAPPTVPRGKAAKPATMQQFAAPFPATPKVPSGFAAPLAPQTASRAAVEAQKRPSPKKEAVQDNFKEPGTPASVMTRRHNEEMDAAAEDSIIETEEMLMQQRFREIVASGYTEEEAEMMWFGEMGPDWEQDLEQETERTHVQYQEQAPREMQNQVKQTAQHVQYQEQPREMQQQTRSTAAQGHGQCQGAGSAVVARSPAKQKTHTVANNKIKQMQPEPYVYDVADLIDPNKTISLAVAEKFATEVRLECAETAKYMKAEREMASKRKGKFKNSFDKYNDMLVDLNEGSLKIDKMLDETKARLFEAQALLTQTENLVCTLVGLKKDYPEVLKEKEPEQENKTENGANDAGSDLSGEQEITSAQKPRPGSESEMEEDGIEDENEKDGAKEIEKEPEVEIEKENAADKVEAMEVEIEKETAKEMAVEGGQVDTGAGNLSSLSAARHTEDAEMSEGDEAVVGKEADKGDEQNLEKATFPDLAEQTGMRSVGADQ